MKDETLTLHPSRRKAIAWLALGLGFGAFFGWIGHDSTTWPDDWVFWLFTAFLSMGGILACTMLLHPKFFLQLTRRGFVISTPFRQKEYAWQKVAKFGVTYSLYGAWVRFCIVPDQWTFLSREQFYSVLSGYDAGLPDTYGMKAEALAELMNDWQGHYGLGTHSRQEIDER